MHRSKDEYVMLAISDTGIGMDSETQNIFEPFFTTKGPEPGSVSLRNYRRAKATFGFSERGKGTAQNLSATCDRHWRASWHRAARREAKVEEATRLCWSKMKVRCADWSANIYESGLHGARSSQRRRCSARAITTQVRIHLLLTDAGNERTQLAQQHCRQADMRVLYMSGYTENVIGHNGTLDPGVNLLQKPFTLPALKARVREVLDTPLPLEVQMSAARSIAQPHFPKRAKISPFRAKRFDLHLPLKYRLLGENDWRAGTTENISRSGLLFRAEEAISTNAQLEINLVLPAEIAGLASAEVVCRGEVVRMVDESSSKVHPALAAKILQYHFQHGSRSAEA
jgi:hypothetical protein